MFVKRRTLQEPINASGLCACGCGTPTPIAAENHPERGYYKGQHTRYVPGHQVAVGVDNHRWKGGRTTHKSGYVYRYAPEHPHANGKGYIYEHRAVMEALLGRVLDPAERVHHKNHDRGDNSPDNLELFQSQREHQRAEHRDALQLWRAHSPEDARLTARAAGQKGAAVRWSGHVKPAPKPVQGTWAPWTRFV
jgi:hypothetical protein